MNSFPASPRILRRTMVAIAAVTGVALLGLTPTVASAQSAPAGDGDDGWVRLAHLSPDTAPGDVQLSADGGRTAVVEVSDVGYGIISDYMLLPVGSYVLSMVPIDAGPDAAPILDASFEVAKDRAITVAAFGENRDLRTRVFEDDLTMPEAGASRIRLIQASTVTDRVSVATTTGLQIAENAETGQSTSYASVPAGSWELELTADGIDDVAKVDLADGSVNTLFVLDNSTGGLTVMPVLDSASVGAAPIGGVQAGGGALAVSSYLPDIGTR